jgi:bifunctional NMN adenylyltransferase/nudix hydrolase
MNMNFDISVCIGRYQVFHNGQLAVLRRALEIAPVCVVVIGSAYQARTPRNPFTWEERAEMIRLALPEDERPRVVFAPVRDYYDTARWTAAVRAAVARSSPSQNARVALVGHRKDATSDYLNDFPGWKLVDVGRQGELHAKALRAVLFTGESVDASLAAIASQVPPTTVDFLRAWAQLPFFATLRSEWQALAQEHEQWKDSPYPPVFVTVDAIVRMAAHVLLIRRGRSPGKGLLALPGGFLEQRETVYQSAVRELEEETGFSMLATSMQAALKQVRVFDHPDRSQRGRVITHAHYFVLGDSPLPEVKGSDDAIEARWVPITELPAMEAQFHDDHFHILDAFLGLPLQEG